VIGRIDAEVAADLANEIVSNFRMTGNGGIGGSSGD
jgi:hypothetical protein